MTYPTDKKEYKRIETTSHSEYGTTVISFRAKVYWSIDGDTLKIEIDYRD